MSAEQFEHLSWVDMGELIRSKQGTCSPEDWAARTNHLVRNGTFEVAVSSRDGGATHEVAWWYFGETSQLTPDEARAFAGNGAESRAAVFLRIAADDADARPGPAHRDAF